MVVLVLHVDEIIGVILKMHVHYMRGDLFICIQSAKRKQHPFP